METLLKDLQKAQLLLNSYTGGYLGKYGSTEEFLADLEKNIKSLQNGDNSSLRELWILFAPTSTWDDFTGIDGMTLGNQIFEQLDKIIKRNRY